MHSKALSQAVDLALDTFGMRGPVTRREVAEHVLLTAPGAHWAAGDTRDAKLLYLQNDIASRMREPLSETSKLKYLDHVPERYYPLFEGLTRFICISANGGPSAQHVLTIKATPDQWQLNYELKNHVTSAVRRSRDHARDVRIMLIDLGVACLADI